MAISLMFIDDDPIHHKLIDLQIKHLNTQITYQCCFNAFDALCYMLDYNNRKKLPDLILLDLEMPLMSGWEAIEYFEIIRTQLVKPVDIIILTSSVSQADREKAQHYTCVKGFLNKPFTQAMFKDILNSSFVSLNKSESKPFWHGISLADIEGLL